VHLFEIGAEIIENGGRDPLSLTNEAEQYVLIADIVVL
jgi:hypothetical protein